MKLSETFLPPRDGGKRLSRKKVRALLDETKKKAGCWAYIKAPGGFGKTLSVAQWLVPQRNKFAWITLNSNDNDPEIFIRKFVRGMAFAQKSNRKLARAVSLPGSPEETLLCCTSLLLHDDKNYVVVLDDFHALTEKETLSLLEKIMKNLPSTFTLCIISRTAPPDQLSSLILSGNVRIITERELAFSESEVRSILTKHHMSVKGAEELMARTEGWPVAVNAFVVGGSEGKKLLWGYVNFSIWDGWSEDVRDFLMRSSVSPVLNDFVCKLLSGREDSRVFLTKLCHRDAFILETEDGQYRFYGPFREFLLEKLSETLGEGELRDLYKTLARGHFDEGDYYEAAATCVRSGDLKGLSACCSALTEYSPQESVETRLAFFKEHVLGKFDLRGDEDFLFIAQCAFMYYLDGDAREFLRLMDVLYLRSRLCDDFQFTGFFTILRSLDFRISLKVYTEKYILNPDTPPSPIFSGKKASPGTFSANMPLMHRALRDRSDLAVSMEEMEDRVEKLKNPFSDFLGEDHLILRQCHIAGILYEQNHLRESYVHAVEAHRLASDRNCRKDLYFAANMILLHVLKAMGRETEASIIVEEMHRWMTDRSLFPMLPNFQAWCCRDRLYAGEYEAAEEWLRSGEVEIMVSPDLYGIYRHFTTERALIASGKMALAILFGDKLLHMSREFNRPIDTLEALLLLSIAHWGAGDRKSSLRCMAEALETGETFGYLRIFINEASAIRPVMLAYLRNAKSSGIRTSSFISEAGLAVMEVDGADVYFPCDALSLSERQVRILELLRNNASYRDIAADLGIGHSTAKYHVLKLYRTLGVSSRSDAVRKGRKLGRI